MKILVCGGRDYGVGNIQEYKHVHATLHEICCLVSMNFNPDDNWLPTDITIIHGCAQGADTAASDFCVVHRCNEDPYPADWALHGLKAGYIRNKQMLDEGKPDVVVAFPGGKGTDMMKRLARNHGVQVIDMMHSYTAPELKMLLNEAILKGDEKAQAAISDMLATEYEETIKAQDIMKGLE